MDGLWAKIREYFWQLSWIDDYPPFARIPWSSIRRIGQSRLLAFTIVVPFLGTLLLFNQSVVDWLLLSPEVVRRLTSSTVQTSAEITRHVTLRNLYYVYFGLSFLGFGSFFFAMLCPAEIKEYGSSREYIEKEAPSVSRARIGLILSQISEYYRFWLPDPPEDETSKLVRRLAMPRAFTSLFGVVVSEIFEAMSSDDTPDGNASAHDEEFADSTIRYYTALGLPNIDVLAEAMWSGRRVERALLEGLRSTACQEQYRGDILAVQYLALDHSRPWSRLIVTFFYAAGFATLSISTLSTFFRLAIGLLR
jgi:hypothetical protein